ncbi:MAG TPA: orotidine-5'-phosphate decarboxylase [Candidatus Nanoarchaeia archaeon]|nr:orotidine-5'-phosphate decarboxylase [Candidatus Nanoarchaeia archaeon]
MENVADRLLNLIDKKRNPCIVGLDPTLEQIPEHIKEDKKDYHNPFEGVRHAIVEFNKLIIDNIFDIVPAVKLQMAFYEKYGSEGVKAFEETARYAQKKGLIVIEDAKRNDIGNTANAYADGHLGKVNLINDNLHSLNVDFITVTPYLGSDGIKPFIDVCKEHGKGIFILVKTSNPSSGELQDKIIDGKETVYEVVARYVHQVGNELIGERGYTPIGAVVGATYPEEAEKLRKIMPKTIFLVPGYGAQGGKAEDVVPCFNDDGYGAVVNSSRGITSAWKNESYKNKFKPEEFHLAARQAAIDMRDDVVKALKQNGKWKI